MSSSQLLLVLMLVSFVHFIAYL